MICKSCGVNHVTTHVKKMINGQMTEIYLCSECAKKLGFFAANNFEMANMWGALFAQTPREAAKASVCDKCGSTFREIIKTGRMGCPECYSVFYDDLLPSLTKIHGNAAHEGKIPDSAGEKAKTDAKIKKLKEDLQNAIQLEEYERAAEIRDEIKQLIIDN